MGRRFISVRIVGEFLVFLAIFGVGVIMTVWASDYVSPPVSEVVMGLGMTCGAVASFWWLRKVGPVLNPGHSGSLTWIASGLVVAIIAFVSGDQYIALGAGIGAGVIVIVEASLARQLSSSDG